MMQAFSWASNGAKLERARMQAGPDASEEAIKEAYIALGGLVLPGNDAPVEEAPAPEAVADDKPKKGKRK